MKSTGIVRELDSLGRIVIPKSLRTIYGLNEKDGLEIFTDGDMLILRKYTPFCVFCGSSEGIISYKGKNICKRCVKEIGSAEGERK